MYFVGIGIKNTSSDYGPVNIIIKKFCVGSDNSGNVVPDDIV